MEQPLSTEQKLEFLEAELAGLRKSNRTVKIACGVLAIACLAFAAIPEASSGKIPTSVVAQQFLLEDAAGNIRASLRIAQNGSLLTMLDSTGKKVLDLGAAQYSDGTPVGGLITYDGNFAAAGNGIPRAEVGVRPSLVGSAFEDPNAVVRYIEGVFAINGGSFAVGNALDGNGVIRASWGAGCDGCTLGQFTGNLPPGFSIVDANNVVRESMGSSLDGTVNGMSVYDSTGANRANMVVLESGKISVIDAVDNNGTAAGAADNQDFGVVGLFANDANGTNRTFDGLTLDGSFHALLLNDSNGTTEVSASESAGTGSIETLTNGNKTGSLP